MPRKLFLINQFNSCRNNTHLVSVFIRFLNKLKRRRSLKKEIIIINIIIITRLMTHVKSFTE